MKPMFFGGIKLDGKCPGNILRDFFRKKKWLNIDIPPRRKKIPSQLELQYLFHNFGSDFGFRISGRSEAQVTWNSRETAGVAVEWLPRSATWHKRWGSLPRANRAGKLEGIFLSVGENAIEFSRIETNGARCLEIVRKITNSRFCCFLSRKCQAEAAPKPAEFGHLGVRGVRGSPQILVQFKG